MGAFGTGFLGSIGDAIHQKAALARANEQKQKDLEAQYHWEALKARLAQGGSVNPTTGQFEPFTPEQRDQLVQDATGNMAKAYGGSKPVKDIMQRAQQLIGKATGHPLWGHPGSENLPASQGGTQPTPAASAPTVAQSTGIPAPPGAQSQSAPAPMALDSSSASDSPAAANMLGSASASDAAPAVSSPTSALASASPEPGKSAPSDNGPSDSSQSQSVAPDTSSSTPVLPRGTISPPPVGASATAPQDTGLTTPPPKAASAVAAPQGLPSAAAGVSSWNPTAHQLMNSFITPYQSAQLNAQQELRQKQGAFDQGQAQLNQKLANLAQQMGRPLTPTEVQLAAGIKIPAGMLVPHYNSKVVLAENAAQNGRMIDGSSPTDHPGQVLQQIGQGSDGIPVYNTVNVPYQKQVIGNQLHAINPMTHEDIGVMSSEPVKTGTTSSSVPSVRYLDNAGNWQVSQGSRSSTPQTGHAPMAPSASAIPAPLSPLSPSAPATVAAAASAAQPPAKRGGSSSASTGSTGRMPGGITLPPGSIPAQQLAQQQNRNTAINVAGQGLTQFTTPQSDGMSNLDIFKDPAAVDRIANYMSLADNKLEGEWDEAEKGGSTGILKFYAGLPQAYTSVQIGAVKDAYDKLTPRDKKFVADFTSLMGQWGGARKGTGASASLYNFKNMSKEIPNPVYVKSYEDAVSRAGNMFNELNQMGEHNGTAKTYDKDKILPKATTKKSGTISAPPGQNAAPTNNAIRPRPKAGDVVDGHKFNGGNPNDPNNWEEVKQK